MSINQESKKIPRRTTLEEKLLSEDFYGYPLKDDEIPCKIPDEPIYWYEEPNVPCCVADLAAQQVEFENDDFQPNTGNSLLKTGRRGIAFEVTMGQPADVNKVQVIQYVSNQSFRAANGQPLPIPKTGPKNQRWAWAPGDDDWIVDSTDDVRCWPDFGPDTLRGLQRNGPASTIEWYDYPGFDLVGLYEQVQEGKIQQEHFPITYYAEFKTDILCSNENICIPESPVARQLLQRNWIIDVVASVTWRFTVTADGRNFSVGWRPFVSAENPPLITHIQRTIYKACPQKQ